MNVISDGLEENGANLTEENGPTEGSSARKRGGGPKTAEGKENSRRNALKHGLCAKVLLPAEMAATVAARKEDFAGEWEPASPYEEWLVGEIALATARLDRCASMAVADLERTIQRASLCWEMDRRMLAEDLGARLTKEPARVARALGRSRQGTDWLIERWEALARLIKANGTWDEPQRGLALDMLGVPHEIRDENDSLPAAHDAEGLARLAETEIRRLRRVQDEALIAVDETEQWMASSGMPMSEDPETARLRKYEASCRRALLQAHAEFRRIRKSAQPEKTAAPRPAPTGSAADDRADRSAAYSRANFTLADGLPPLVGTIWNDEVPTPKAITWPELAPGTLPTATLTRVSALRSAAGPRNRRERLACEARERESARRSPSR
jgi:hypothetical protein